MPSAFLLPWIDNSHCANKPASAEGKAFQVFDFEKRSRRNLSDFGSPLRLITLRSRLWEKRQIFAVTFFRQFLHRNETQRG